MLRIAELRKARGMTQYQLAMAVGVTTGAVAAWELGRNTPRLEIAARLAEVFGVTIDELYTKEVS